VVLSDTAGLRPDPDEIERIGIERARTQADHADGAILVLDRSCPLTPDDVHVLDVTRDLPSIVVLNKCDLAPAWGVTMLPQRPHLRAVLEVSARTRMGLPELRGGILACFETTGIDANVPMLTLARHRDLLTRAHEAVQLAVTGLDSGTAVDVVAVDVQSALEYIGAITGEVTTEEVLDRIFREFCIGK
jgi:tRNA modification GTPase